MTAMKTVLIRRTLVAEYEIPIDQYGGMTQDQIRDLENSADQLDATLAFVLEEIVSDTVEVTFND